MMTRPLALQLVEERLKDERHAAKRERTAQAAKTEAQIRPVRRTGA